MTQQNAQPALHQPQPDAAALADAGLVAGVRAGDPAGFEMIMRRHNRRLYRLARGIGKIVVNEAVGRLRKRGRVISFEDHVKGADGSVDHRASRL